jgi:exonuclease-1
MMQKHKITPIMVFDGGMLPIKEREESQRHALRKKNREKAEQLFEAGQRHEANKKY